MSTEQDRQAAADRVVRILHSIAKDLRQVAEAVEGDATRAAERRSGSRPISSHDGGKGWGEFVSTTIQLVTGGLPASLGQLVRLAAQADEVDHRSED